MRLECFGHAVAIDEVDLERPVTGLRTALRGARVRLAVALIRSELAVKALDRRVPIGKGVGREERDCAWRCVALELRAVDRLQQRDLTIHADADNLVLVVEVPEI